ncbi:kazrin isoform X1 [Vespula squamosa]|uniref:Kazrin isoform X1 n=1 Tax=Vespula squamosa TaxID=30214 RepID=A0ABD2BH93_VESSQ
MLVLKTNTTLLYKDLFEWWNEETGYIFRRIRKSALARGYNRWSSERLSEDRLTMQAERLCKRKLSLRPKAAAMLRIFDLLNQMKALYGILEDKERELRDFIRNYEQRMRENEATLGRFQQQEGGMSSEERERERERGRWSLLRAVGNEADRSLSLAACLADKEVALSHARATIKELQRQLTEGGGGGACLSDQATPGAGSNSCGGVSGIIPHIDSQPLLGTTELG